MPSKLRFALFIAALAGCSYYPSDTSGAGGTTATGGSGGSTYQGGGGSGQAGNGGATTSSTTTSSTTTTSTTTTTTSTTTSSTTTSSTGGSAPFLTCDDVAANHAVMKVEVVGSVPAGVTRLAADGYNTKQAPGVWDVQYVGPVGATQVVKDWGVSLSGFKADTNWGFALDGTAKVVGSAAPVVEPGTWLCRGGVCEDQNIVPMKASFIGCYGTTVLGTISGAAMTGIGLSFPPEGDQANVMLTVP